MEMNGRIMLRHASRAGMSVYIKGKKNWSTSKSYDGVNTHWVRGEPLSLQTHDYESSLIDEIKEWKIMQSN